MRVDFPAPDGAEITNSLPFLMFITNLVDEGRKQGCVSILRIFHYSRIPTNIRVQYGMRVGREVCRKSHLYNLSRVQELGICSEQGQIRSFEISVIRDQIEPSSGAQVFQNLIVKISLACLIISQE